MNKKIPITFFVTLLSSIFAFLILQNGSGWHSAVMNWWNPSYAAPALTAGECSSKIINLYFWKEERLQKKATSLVWSSHHLPMVRATVMAWLATLKEEGIITYKVSVEECLWEEATGKVYISFNESFLNNNSAVYDKWQQVEALLATLNELFPFITLVFLETHHSVMADAHLDFSQGLVIEGYKESVFEP